MSSIRRTSPKIDRLANRTITLPEGEYKIFSRQNPAYVTPQAVKDGKIAGGLTIDQPERFWETVALPDHRSLVIGQCGKGSRACSGRTAPSGLEVLRRLEAALFSRELSCSAMGRPDYVGMESTRLAVLVVDDEARAARSAIASH